MKYNIDELAKKSPIVREVAEGKETFWLNPKKTTRSNWNLTAVTQADIDDAEQRLQRFAPYLETVFPELRETHGLIESSLLETAHMKEYLNEAFQSNIEGRLFLKMDSDLPISGSVKARGGFYEVLKYAEHLAMKEGMLKESDNYAIMAEPRFLEFFNRYTIQVGSTGNLGMSIGIMSAKVGFKVIVHMSADAKQWKKDLLRSRGVTVIEYNDNYCAAVDEGRRNSDADPMSYFVDDEKSKDLFMGYSVAGPRVKSQLESLNIQVDEEHPLFVYIPCGIGGAPGGVTYGLKEAYGDNVHCFFTEPTQACCMLLGMATELHDQIAVEDIGMPGKTEADGLAVGRPSAFVGKIMEPLVSGIATIEDDKLYVLMKELLKREGLFIEPSSCAGYAAFLQAPTLQAYVEQNHLTNVMDKATHIVWATGGSMVPEDVRAEYLKK